jgi:hypothetical protein
MSAAEAKTGRLPPASDANGPDVARIALPRAVGLHIRNSLRGIVNASDDDCGEEKCRECAPVRLVREALAVLDAALEAQEDEALLNEPVAMRYDGDGYGYLYIDSGSGSDWQRRHKDAEPLYTTPPKPDAKREPATDEQIIKSHLHDDHRFLLSRWDYFHKAWREAERFHGIRKEDGK